MAVLDHPTHPSVVAKADARYGCHNRPEFRDYYWAPKRRFLGDDSFDVVATKVRHFGSTECRYDRSLVDPKCEGCARRGSGEAYDQFIREKGNK